MGRRILQKVTNNGVVTYKRYQWCGNRICQQRPATGTSRTRSYLLTGEYDFTASKKYVYFLDHLGSVRDLADADTGARVGALDYTPYGAPRASDGVLPDFRYARLMWAGEMGLYMSSTRAYDPGNTRWLNLDPIRERGGINLYGYVGDNPLMGVDPLGLCSTTAGTLVEGSDSFIKCMGLCYTAFATDCFFAWGQVAACSSCLLLPTPMNGACLRLCASRPFEFCLGVSVAACGAVCGVIRANEWLNEQLNPPSPGTPPDDKHPPPSNDPLKPPMGSSVRRM